MPSEPKPTGKPNLSQLKPAALIGRRLGRFKVTSVLGKGAMGLVLLAQDVTLKRRVALKLLPYNKDADGKERVYQEQFIREARSAAQIIHPAIVQIFEVGIAEGFFFIAMEVLESGSLDGVVELHGPLEWQQAVEFTAQAAEGLAYAHERGIMHRDIKPANLMLADSGHCKLADFGLAVIDDPDDPFKLPWKVVGTPCFMAPEVARGKSGPAGDLFALTGVLWYLLTGEPPFKITKLKDVVKIHKAIALPDLREKRADVPPALAALVERGLAYDAEARFGSAAEMVTALRGTLASGSVVGDAPAAPKKMSKGVLAGIGLAAVALIAVGITLAVVLSGPEPDNSGPVIVIEPADPTDPIDDPDNGNTGILPTDVDGPSTNHNNTSTSHGTTTPPRAGDGIPTGGRSVLAADALGSIEAVLADGATTFGAFSQIDVAGESFKKAARVAITTPPNDARLARLRLPVPGEVLAGHRYLLTFQLQADDAGAVTAQLQRTAEPNEVIVIADATAGQKWQRIDIPFSPAFSVPGGRAELELHVGQDKQAIQIADVRLLDYGKSKDLASLPRSASVMIDTPLPDPLPRDVFGAMVVAGNTGRIVRMATQGDPRPYVFAGEVGGLPGRAGSDWMVPLNSESDGLAMLFDDASRLEVCRALGVGSPTDLRGKSVIAIGRVMWSDKHGRPILKISDPAQVRTATLDGKPIAIDQRQKLVDAALYEREVLVTAEPTGIELIEGNRFAKLVYKADDAPGDLLVRYPSNLFAPMTNKFGGQRGSGIAGRQIAFRATPQYDPLAETLTATLSTTTNIDLADAMLPIKATKPMALRFQVKPAAGSEASPVGLTQIIDRKIKKDSAITYIIRMRADRDGVKVRPALRLIDPKAADDVSKELVLTKAWQDFQVQGRLSHNYEIGGWQFQMAFDTDTEAVVDVASVFLKLPNYKGNALSNGDFTLSDRFWDVSGGGVVAGKLFDPGKVTVASAENNGNNNTPPPPPADGPKILRFNVDPVGGEKDSAASVFQPIAGPIGARDEVVFIVRARSVVGRGVLGLAMQDQNGGVTYGSQPVQVTDNWRDYALKVRMNQARQPNQSRLLITANHRKAVVDIASITMQVNGKPVGFLKDPKFTLRDKHWKLTKGKNTKIGFRHVPQPAPLPAGVEVFDVVDDRAKISEKIKAADGSTVAIKGDVRSATETHDGDLFITLRSRVSLFVIAEAEVVKALNNQYGLSPGELRGETIRVVGTITKRDNRNVIVVSEIAKFAILD